MTEARNAAEIVAQIEEATVAETADVVPPAEAVAGDVDAAAQAAVAAAVSAAADTAEAVTRRKMEDGRPARPAKRPRNHRGLYSCAAHVGAGAPIRPGRAKLGQVPAQTSIDRENEKERAGPSTPQLICKQINWLGRDDSLKNYPVIPSAVEGPAVRVPLTHPLL